MNAQPPLSRRTFLTAACGTGASAVVRAAEPAPVKAIPPKAIDDAVATAMKEWSVPGACVGVVHGDEVRVRGYGVREAGTKKEVTPATVFGVGSCTKAFCATAAAVLVGQKKLGWDDPVRKHLPWFRMADPLAERELTLRDCLCHRIGWHEKHDLLYYMAPWSLEEVVRRVAHLELAFPFRSVFHYGGLNYHVAPMVVAAAAGKPWHVFAREKLLAPLGMTETAFTKGEWDKLDNRAATHLKTARGDVVVIPPWNPVDDQIDASGRLKASGNAMCAWIRMQLDGGRHDGKEVVPKANLLETHTPQMAVRREGLWADAFPTAESVQLSYGLGWKVRDYRGHAVLSHAGRTTGFSAETVLVPNSKLGFVILTNLDENWMPEALMHTLLDLHLGLPRTNWNAHYREVAEKLEKAAAGEKVARAAKQIKNTKPTLAVGEYAGTYLEPAYKDVQVVEKAGKLWMKWSSFKAELKHFHYDTFAATGDGGVNVYNENPLDGEPITFVLDGDGRVGSIEWYGRRFKRAEG
jgi:CubicO group peptidase (beta-lactamase class C family)